MTYKKIACTNITAISNIVYILWTISVFNAAYVQYKTIQYFDYACTIMPIRIYIRLIINGLDNMIIWPECGFFFNKKKISLAGSRSSYYNNSNGKLW